ncbi:MAG: LysM peptidoglycan-binding domain-containing protein [Candidatus Aegiribacteria sp.]|nr:LysM peptidoglycan-binding domain-containing protein [Candidatus Aegiribacteria sp.]
MKSFTVILSVLILLIGAVFSVSAAARTHYVRYGDTLWELSIHYYNTPFHWEDILNANPFLEGVEYLQPGSELILPDISGTTITQQAFDSGFSGVYITSGTSSRPILSRLILETAGMVTSDPPDAVSYIIELDVENEEEYSGLASYPGDLVAIDIGRDQGVMIDMVYKIYETGEEVRHPQTGITLGNVIRVAGVCRVIDTSISSSVVLIEHAFLPVITGDFLVPYTSSAPIPVAGSIVVEDIDAYIIAFKNPDLERAYSYDIVYIDRGTDDGLSPGDIFSMFKYGHEVVSPSGATVMTPDLPISELIIVETLQNTSAALITSVSTTDLVCIGDKIELIRKQL